MIISQTASTDSGMIRVIQVWWNRWSVWLASIAKEQGILSEVAISWRLLFMGATMNTTLCYPSSLIVKINFFLLLSHLSDIWYGLCNICDHFSFYYILVSRLSEVLSSNIRSSLFWKLDNQIAQSQLNHKMVSFIFFEPRVPKIWSFEFG